MATTANYLKEITQGRAQPESTLKVAQAAINSFTRATGATSPTTNPHINHLINTIITKHTTRPLYSQAPLNPTLITNYWQSKPTNNNLSKEDLHTKALTIFTLVKFLRPSDTAHLNQTYMQWHNNNTKCTFIKWGFKNNHALMGNTRFMPTHHKKIMCPLSTLHNYHTHTATKEAKTHTNLQHSYNKQWANTPDKEQPPFKPFIPLFMALKDGHPISTNTCTKIMKHITVKARANPQMFSTRSYHKGRANYTLANSMTKQDMQWIRKWKNKDIFKRHYISIQAPTNYTQQLFSTNNHTPPDNNTHNKGNNTRESLFSVNSKDNTSPASNMDNNWYKIKILNKGTAAGSSPQLHTSSTSFPE